MKTVVVFVLREVLMSSSWEKEVDVFMGQSGRRILLYVALQGMIKVLGSRGDRTQIDIERGPREG